MSDCNDQLDLPPDLRAVPQALQWLENIALRESWPAREVFGLSLCLDEALTNVIAYAFDPPVAEPAIHVACQISDNRIELALRDNGRAYDPTAGEPPPLASTLDDASIGGHGVRLMRHYLHDMTYRREAGWNRLSMVVLIE